ncbi:MAG TPA: VWA domain-containing protein [Ohtaekwangia sp.]|uniref:vWA domain-containing protein n=1 Tax=Ohtaekwangia sp. TaxID=2066019 RepID=UPI002F92F918
MNRYIFLITLRGALLCMMVITCCSLGFAQKKLIQGVPEKTRILFLFDGSGSMLEPWGKPNQIKINIAKSILTQIVDSLSHNDKLELALRIYGHRSPREANNCKDTWLEVPFKPKNHKLIIDKINEIKPKGVTPITYSLEQAAKDFPGGIGYRNIVILITDGIESCGGDLCATSRELQKKGVFLRPYIIGLGLRAEKTLDCAGKYISAETPQAFHEELNKAIQATFSKTTVSVELLDARNQPTETNVNVSFVNSLTGISMYDFVHYRDSQGRPDSVQIDPVVDYDFVVNTIPPVVKRNVAIGLGKHNTIRIPVPQGNLQVQQEGRKDNNLEVIVREKDKTNIIHVQHSNETVRYITGKYEIETLTLPRRKFTVDIQANKTQNIYLPAPGIVNFNTISTGYGSLYEMNADGTQQWICNLDNLKANFTFTMLPGRYKIVFRVKNASGSKFTGFKVFDLTPGETKMLNVFN